MSVLTSPELYINMRDIPTEDSEEYHPFFRNELDKIEYGVTINGVYIHGWLYWHWNHWKMWIDYEDERSKEVKSYLASPQWRDNEWLIAEYLKMAEDEKKGLMLFGTRRFAKSHFEASYIGRSATIYQGTENVIAGGNTDDIKIITSKVDKGLINLHQYFRFERIFDDWSREVSLGVKSDRNTRMEWSKILIRNFDNGKNTEAIAGTTPKSLVIDEVGKYKFLEGLTSAKPALTSRFGWRCVPILTGTGGMFVPNSDAERLFNNPESQNFLAVNLPNRNKKFGIFIPATYIMEAKEEVAMGDWLLNKKGVIIPKESELYNMTFQQSNEETARQVVAEQISQARTSLDPKEALKLEMYLPFEPEQCFLTEDVNNFPIEAIRDHIEWLDRQQIGQAVKLFRNADNSVGFSYDTNLKQVMDFPVTPQTLKDAPVIMYEPPMANPPHLLYIGGSDPYNTSKSITSESLGTVYIYKRLYDPVAGTYQNTCVASLASRPKEMKEWHLQVEMLIDLYNATLMIENVGTNFIEYLKNKNREYLLADGYNLLKQISPNSKAQQTKGLPPTPRVINHCMNLLYEYCKEELDGEDPGGNPIKKLGVTRIPDRMLLIEMLNYHKDGNYDRIVAFRHALAYDVHLQRVSPIVRYNPNPQENKFKPLPTSPFLLKPANSFAKIGRSRTFRL